MTASSIHLFIVFLHSLSKLGVLKAGVLRQQWYMITIQQRAVKSSVSKQSANVSTLVSVIDY